MKNRINIGTASIILIFIILCLSVFALLGLSDGRSTKIFAERYADSVTAYYQADMAGQHFIRDVWKALEDGRSIEEAGEAAIAALPENSTLEMEQNGTLFCDIPVNADQVLHIELDVKHADIPAYYVYNKEDYAIDNRLPIWTGSSDG